MKVLVTGATGYLGTAIVHALTKAGHDAVVFARHATSAGLPGVAVDGDVRDSAAVQRAADGVDAVCHTAALVSLWRPRHDEYDDVNVRGLETVLRVCESRGIGRIVYTSTFLALPPPGAILPLAANDYQRTKVLALRVVRAAVARGVPVVTLYPGVIYGSGRQTEGNLVGRLVRDHLEGRLPGIVGASRVWSFAHVDDVAAGHVGAIESGTAGEEFVLGGENAPQMRLFEVVRTMTGRSLPRRIPYAVAAAAGVLDEARARVTGRPPLITRGTVAIFRYDWPLDSTHSHSRLGYRTRPLAAGIRDVVWPPG